MNKKLIFIRKGKEDLDQIYFRMVDDEIINPELGISYYLYDIDEDIRHEGFKKVWKECKLCGQLNEWYVTSYPEVLDWNYLWYNNEFHKWEIYFIENGKLVNIHDIYPNIKPFTSITRMYLSNLLGEQ